MQGRSIRMSRASVHTFNARSPLLRTHPCVVTAQYKEVVVRVNSEQFAEFDHVLIDVNQVR